MPSRSDTNFDALRIGLASLVIVSHVAVLKTGSTSIEPLKALTGTLTLGEFAVDAFFVISGYLIARSWLSSPDLSTFAIKRAARILPGFIVAYLLSCLVFPLAAMPLHTALAAFDWRGMIKMTAPTPAIYYHAPYPYANGSLWTIRLELHCYLLTALLGLGGLLKRKVVVAALWVALLALAVCAFHSRLQLSPYELALLRLVPFYLAGTTFAVYRERIPYPNGWPFLACALVFVGLFVRMPFLPIGITYAVLGLARLPSGIGRFFAGHRDISYGTYLYGWPVVKLVYFYWPGLTVPFVALISLVVACAAGWASSVLVEEPFLKLRASRPKVANWRSRTQLRIEQTRPATEVPAYEALGSSG